MKQSKLRKALIENYSESDNDKFDAERDTIVQDQLEQDVPMSDFGAEQILKVENEGQSYNNVPHVVSNAITASNNDSFINFITAGSEGNKTIQSINLESLQAMIEGQDIDIPDGFTASLPTEFQKRNGLLGTAIARGLMDDAKRLSISFRENGSIPSKAQFCKFINENSNSKTLAVIEGVAKQLKPVDAISFISTVKAGIDGILTNAYKQGRIVNTEGVKDGMEAYQPYMESENGQQNTYNNLFKMAVIMFSNLTPGFIKSSVIKILPTSNIPSKTVTVVYSNAFGRIGNQVAQILTGINRVSKHNEIATYFRDGSSQQLEFTLPVNSGIGSAKLNETAIFEDSYIKDLFTAAGKYKSIPPVSIKITHMSTTHAFLKTNPTTKKPEFDPTPIVNGVLLSSGSLTSVQNTGANTTENGEILLTHTGVTPVVLAPPQYAVVEQSGFVFDVASKRMKQVCFTITFNQNTTNLSVSELPDADGNTYIKDITVEFIPEPGYNNRKEDKTISSYVTTNSQSFTVNEYVESKIDTPSKQQATYAEATSGDNIVEKQRKMNSMLTAHVIEKAAYDKIIAQTEMFDSLYGDKNIYTEQFDLSSINRVSPGDKTTDIDITKKIQEIFKEGIRQAIMKLTEPFWGITTKGIFIVCNPTTLQSMGLEGLTKYNDYKLSSESDIYKMDIGGTPVAFVTSSLTKSFMEETNPTPLDEHVMYAHIVLGDLSSLSTVYGKAYEISSANGYAGRDGIPFVRNINEYDFISRFPTSLKIKVKGLIKTSNPNPNDLANRVGAPTYRDIS